MNHFIKAIPVWQKNTEKEMNLTLDFKSIFKYTKNKSYTIKIAASTIYQLYINGIFVNAGPARAAHGFYRIDEIDITEYLKEGNNVAAIIVTGHNINNFYTINQPSFLQSEIIDDINNCICYTGSKNKSSAFLFKRNSDRVQKVMKYSFQRAFAESFCLKNGNTSWRTETNFEDEKWELPYKTDSKQIIARNLPPYNFPKVNVQEVIDGGTVTSGHKPSEYFKPFFLSGVGPRMLGYTDEELEVKMSDNVQELVFSPEQNFLSRTVQKDEQFNLTNEYVSFALDAERTGFIGMKIRCSSKATLFLFFNERLSDSGTIEPITQVGANIIQLDLEKGEYDFLTYEPYGFKYIKATCIDGAVNISDIYLREYICPTPLLSLSDIIDADILSDQKMRTVLDAAINTYKQNVVDIYMDCPTRERAGWLGDSFFTGRTELALTGKNEVEYNFLENYLLPETFENIPEKMIPMCYPSDHYDHTFIPTWAMWFILELEDYFNRTKSRGGDTEFVMKFRKRVYDLLSYFSDFENEYGLLEKLDSWVFVEWSKAQDFVQDVNYPANMLYAESLCAAGRLFNDEDQIKKGEKLKKVICNRSYNGEYFIDNEVRVDGKLVLTGERSETCQYYAFFCNVATPSTYPKLWNKLLNEFGPNRTKYPEIYPSNVFIGNLMRLDLLCRYGYKEKLISEIKEFFYYMAITTGTLWENTTPHASCNHCFSAYIIYLLSKI